MDILLSNQMIGAAFSHYRVIEELGTGGMGVVYRAEDLTLRRRVALKFLAPAIARNRQAVERFLREARAAAALNHPNICTIYEAGEHDGQSYIAMECIEGQTLQQYLTTGTPSLDFVLDMAIQIADGLRAAHDKGIIHRDIKPANIYVTPDARIKLLDFGLAKAKRLDVGAFDAEDTAAFSETAQLTACATVIGTVAYMSPEQARGDKLDGRTDLFSFGAVLYELCTGRPPFIGSTAAVIFNALLSQAPPSPSSLVENLPTELEAVIGRALEKDPARRYQHASQIVADLQYLRRRLESGAAADQSRMPSSLPSGADLVVVEEAPHPVAVVTESGLTAPLRDYLERFPDVGTQQLRPEQYVWPAASMQDSMGQDISTEHVGQLLKSVLLEDPNAFVLLLGDYGSGKTSFMRMFGRELAGDALAADLNAPIPIYLNLGFARHSSDLLDAISAYVARYGVSIQPAQLKDFLLRRRNAVLLLDGFDEMASRVDYRIVPQILEKIRGLQLATGVRIVLSGRSSFFRSDIEVGIVGAGYVVRLQPFDDKSMLAYINLRYPNLTSRAAALFQRHANVRALCRNPIHLMLFVNWLGVADQTLRRSAAASGDGALGPPSAADLDDLSVVGLYHRFFQKTLQDNFGIVTRWPLDQRWAFIRRVAWDWFKEGIFEWPLSEFSKRIETELPGLTRDEIDEYTLQLLNCTFFTRVGDRYRFLHQSYVEYLVSEALCEVLQAGDLTMWDTPLYTDVYEMTYQLLQAQGFERIPVDWVMETGSVRAQGNFLAMSWRHRPPAMEPHLRKQLRHNPHDIVRFLAAMGLGLYEPSAENVRYLQAAFFSEANTVVQAMIQRVASQWLSNAALHADLSRELQPVVDAAVALRTEDAERALLQGTSTAKDGDRVLFAFRRAMIQGDNLWTAAVGGMLALAVVQHSSSISYIYNMAALAKHPEIRKAYDAVRSFTGLPELPTG